MNLSVVVRAVVDGTEVRKALLTVVCPTERKAVGLMVSVPVTRAVDEGIGAMVADVVSREIYNQVQEEVGG